MQPVLAPNRILWLASYPKSGNTWLRAFIANYLADQRLPVEINSLPDFAHGDMRVDYYAQVAGRAAEELTQADIDALRPAVHRFLAASRREIVFVKTHSALGIVGGVPTITPDATFGAIYVVRNPLDTAVSFADHYGVSLDSAVGALCFPQLEIEPKAGHVRQTISDWSTHVRSWLGAPGLHRLVVRYEDMLAVPRRGFGAVVEFLGLPKDRERLQRAIRHSSFRVLAEQERRQGFVERSRHAERFFRRGEAGGWRKALSNEQVGRIVQMHGPLMGELGYLAADGTPVG